MLRAASLAKRFGGVRAVHDVTFEIAAGAVHSIIGPNGAGKTTLLNLLSGIERPDAGEIFFDGAALTGAPPHRFAADSSIGPNAPTFATEWTVEARGGGRHRSPIARNPHAIRARGHE